MTISQGKYSSGSRRATRRVKAETKLSRRQKNFLRRLVNVLTNVIDEKDFSDDTKDDSGAKESSTLPNDSMSRRSEVGNAEYLMRFADKHDPIVEHAITLLSALGGGGETAEALRCMKLRMKNICHSFVDYRFDVDMRPERRGIQLCVDDFVKSLRIFKGFPIQTSSALLGLGIFSSRLHDSLLSLRLFCQQIALGLEMEYTHAGKSTLCYVDDYLNSMLEPLVRTLETYIEELTSILEKDIPAIRQSQEFVSQRYLNLTTIATFLSSVTATTLQITADGPVSVLTTTTNSFWFVSLVFSSASAIYSLLLMTWRQSPVRRPDESLSPLARIVLRNAPMFALIVALMTFSIGLCLLAFLVADRQGRDVSAIVPTTFTGLHAHIIFFFSLWYLSEQWKGRLPRSWKYIQGGYTSTARWIGMTLFRAGYRSRFTVLRNALSSKISNLFWKKHESGVIDVELGRDEQTDPSYPHSSSIPPVAEQERENTADPENNMAVCEVVRSSTESLSCSQAGVENVRPEDLMQFSPDCELLASSFSNIVTIYEVGTSRVLHTIAVPDGSKVIQVSWNPNLYRSGDKSGMFTGDTEPNGIGDQVEMFVRSCKSVYVYTFLHWFESDPLIQRLEWLDSATGPMRWVREREDGLCGISCILGNSLKVFNPSLLVTGDDRSSRDRAREELYSCDFSDFPDVDAVLDAALYKQIFIVCLTSSRTSGLRILVINRLTTSVAQKCRAYPDCQSLSVSRGAWVSLYSGGKMKGVIELGRLFESENTIDSLKESDSQERAAGILGQRGDLCYIVYDGRIDIILIPLSTWFSRTQHSISTPLSRAIVENATSFALGRSHNSPPYLFAFGARDGSVKIWSVLSNRALDPCEAAEPFEVHDGRTDPLSSTYPANSMPVVSMGKFVTLPPPSLPERTPSSCEGGAES